MGITFFAAIFPSKKGSNGVFPFSSCHGSFALSALGLALPHETLLDFAEQASAQILQGSMKVNQIV